MTKCPDCGRSGHAACDDRTRAGYLLTQAEVDEMEQRSRPVREEMRAEAEAAAYIKIGDTVSTAIGCGVVIERSTYSLTVKIDGRGLRDVPVGWVHGLASQVEPVAPEEPSWL